MNPTEHSAAPGPVDALRRCWQAETARWTTVARILLTETRLAGGSALTLLVLASIALVLSLISWLLLMALLILGLAAFGLGLATAVGIVLLLHLLAVMATGLAARRCLADLRFEHTLAALGLSGRKIAADPTAPEPDGPTGDPPGAPSGEPVRHA